MDLGMGEQESIWHINHQHGENSAEEVTIEVFAFLHGLSRNREKGMARISAALSSLNVREQLEFSEGM